MPVGSGGRPFGSAPEPRFARELPTIPPLPFRRGEGRSEGSDLGFRDAKRVRIQGGSLLPARRSRVGKSLEKPAAAGFLACGQQTLPGVSAFWAKAEEERKDSEVEAKATQSHLKPTTSHVLGRGLRHASQVHARYMRHTSQVQATPGPSCQPCHRPARDCIPGRGFT